ncbi:MAG: ATP-dependent DNA helicase [Lachnospira sp.]|nr:ATP-dependent DNA helicase [Lachnospira sp.]
MYVIKDNVLKISVRNLVEFICRSGDIESGGGRDSVKAMQEGARLHRKIQKSMGSMYHAEIMLRHDIPCQVQDVNYVIHIEGRADGIICDLDEDDEGNRVPVSDVVIDEIKTITRDVKKMTEAVYVHKAQALVYAYIYSLQKGIDKLSVQITYCNPETEEIRRFKEEYGFKQLEIWFEELMGKFVLWTDYIFSERKKRTESIQGLQFPYPYRDGQRDLVVSVYRAIQQEKVLYIQAPTGVGKTLSTVFPSVQAMGQGMLDKIFYLTSKTITRKVAQDAYALLRDKGLSFRALTITAKDKVCMCEERKCNPKDCPYAKGHYDRVNDAIYDVVTNNYVIDRACVEEYAKKHQVCPFEMSLDISYWCDGIICDYNYVFDPNVALKRYFGESVKGDYAFLVDEAHNLVDRAREMYSATLIKEDVLKVKNVVKDVDKRLASSLERCNKDLLELKRQCDTMRIIDDCAKFVADLERAAGFMGTFLEKHPEFEKKDEVLEFYFDVKHFLAMYDCKDYGYVLYTEHDSDANFRIRLYCVDPSEQLSERIAMGKSAVFFSATLLPVNYYKEMLSGDADDYAVYAKSSFPGENRCVLVGKDVSSRYSRRGEAEYRKIVAYIAETVKAHKGKYMVFFPSYAFMEAVKDMFCSDVECDVVVDCEKETLKEFLLEENIHVVSQNSRMREQDKEWFLSLFDDYECNGSLVGFCVTGGVFSEGIDLREDSLIGVIVVGTGLPMICRERDILKNYFDECGKDGYSYAYVYPGMNKVEQAAGRVIRTHEDRGVIELLDDRFLTAEYRALYPREWDNVKTVTKDSVGDEVHRFWG